MHFKGNQMFQLGRWTKNLVFSSLFLTGGVGLQAAQDRPCILVEAESFADRGGWKLDTQFIHEMGSPYLLAHGLGRPVADATTTVEVAEAGRYRVWVRTKDWVARWQAPGTPGRFQLLVNDKPIPEKFGTTGAEWHWQAGGEVELTAGSNRLTLHDLTGFDGRCDAIAFTQLTSHRQTTRTCFLAGGGPPSGCRLNRRRRGRTTSS